MKMLTLSLATLALATGSAHAQDSATPAPDQGATLPEQSASETPPATSDAVPPSTAADPATEAPTTTASTAVTDAEVQSYASATVKVHEISKNASLDDQAKQQQMASAVTEAGLDPQRYNAISAALGSDTTLRARVETALAAHAAAHQG